MKESKESALGHALLDGEVPPEMERLGLDQGGDGREARSGEGRRPAVEGETRIHYGGPVPLFKIAFWANTVLQVVIRAPYGMSTRSRQKTEQRVSQTERALLLLVTIATGILPLIYSVTDWLEFADYTLPEWMGRMGILIMGCSLLIFLACPLRSEGELVAILGALRGPYANNERDL